MAWSRTDEATAKDGLLSASTGPSLSGRTEIQVDKSTKSAFESYAEEYKHDPDLVEGPEQVYECAFGAHLYISNLKSRLERTAVDILPRAFWMIHALEGDALIDFDDSSDVRITAGDTIILSVHDAAQLVNHIRENQQIKSIAVIAEVDRVADDQIADAIDRQLTSTSLSMVSPSPVVGALARDLDTVTDEMDLAGLAAESYAASMLRRCLLTNRSSGRGDRGRGRNPILQRRLAMVRDRLIAEPDVDHSLAILARDAGIGVSTLKHRFTEAYGKSVFSFLYDVRLKRALEQLKESDLSISQIAYSAGFKHPANFSTAFRKRFGVSPGTVRKAG